MGIKEEGRKGLAHHDYCFADPCMDFSWHWCSWYSRCWSLEVEIIIMALLFNLIAMSHEFCFSSSRIQTLLQFYHSIHSFYPSFRCHCGSPVNGNYLWSILPILSAERRHLLFQPLLQIFRWLHSLIAAWISSSG